MKILKQFFIILLISALGDLLNSLIPLPVPGTVWGMLLLFAALLWGIVKLEQVEDTADFFMSILPLLFVPFGVSLLRSYHVLARHALAIVVITIVSFFICFAVTGKTADFLIARKNKADAAAGREEVSHG